jgi:hypothetical protein
MKLVPNMINFCVNNWLEISLQKIGDQAGHQFYKTFFPCSSMLMLNKLEWLSHSLVYIFCRTSNMLSE